MKIRSTFVSNSSSSSYVCVICGHEESGWDLSMSEAEMISAAGNNSVYYCTDHLEANAIVNYIRGFAKYHESTKESESEMYTEMLFESGVEHEEFVKDCADLDDNGLSAKYDSTMMYIFQEYGSPEEICILEKLEYITKTDMVRYLLHCIDKDENTVLNDIKNTHSTLSNLNIWLSKNSDKK